MQQKVKHGLHEQILDDVGDHIDMLDEDAWEFADESPKLSKFADLMIDEFNLDIPLPIIGSRKLRKGRYGQYERSRNEMGIRFVIIYNEIYQQYRRNWQHISNLLIQLIHEWQDVNGTPPKTRGHNKEYITKIKDFGIKMNRKGEVIEFDLKGPFIAFLDKHGVQYNTNDPPDQLNPTATNTRKKIVRWKCKCDPAFKIPVEDGVYVDATCNACSNAFSPL